MMTMEVDQRSTDQRRCFNRNPEESEMTADSDQRHGRQEEEQAADETGFGRVAEKKMFFEIGYFVL